MNTLVNKSILLIAALFVALTVLNNPNIAHAADPAPQSAKDAACESVGGKPDGKGGCIDGDENLGGTSISNLLATALNILSFVAGVAAVIMIIVSGIKYTTSGGDAGSISSAKNTLLYAIIGIIIVAMSQAIVRFVINDASSVGQPVEEKAGYNPTQEQYIVAYDK